MNITHTTLYNSSPESMNKIRLKSKGAGELTGYSETGTQGFKGRINNAVLRENITGVRLEKQAEIKKTNLNNNATTAGENPSGRLSFKGNPSGMAVNLAKSGAFNWVLDVTQKNSLVADALFALFLTAGLRPLSIGILPTKDEDDKKKNRYQIAHSIATGIMGLATTVAVAVPVKAAVETFFKRVMNNPQLKEKVKYIFKSPATEAMFKETAGRLHQPFFLPLRAFLTIKLVSPILEALGFKKQPLKPDLNPMFNDLSSLNFKNSEKSKKTFQNFTGILQADNGKANDNQKKNSSKPSFKGAPINAMASGIGFVANSRAMKAVVEWLAGSNWGFPHLVAAESLWLSGFYMNHTAKSKTIEKDQKLPMIINQGIVALASTLGAYTIDGLVNKTVNKFKNTYTNTFNEQYNKEIKQAFKEQFKENYKNIFEEIISLQDKKKPIEFIEKTIGKKYRLKDFKLDKIAGLSEKVQFIKNFRTKFDVLNPDKSVDLLNKRLKGISFLKTTVIFALIYRFLGPVILTPAANWISNKIQKPENKAK